MKTNKYRRSSEVKLSNEARFLRKLRQDAGLSIREAGRRAGYSESYLRHIEMGRANFPKECILKLILSEYGISIRQFSNLVMVNFDNKDRDELTRLIKNLNDEDSKLALKLIKSIFYD